MSRLKPRDMRRQQQRMDRQDQITAGVQGVHLDKQFRFMGMNGMHLVRTPYGYVVNSLDLPIAGLTRPAVGGPAWIDPKTQNELEVFDEYQNP
jgi:hypothetical protein